MRIVGLGWCLLWALFSVPWTTATSSPQWERVRPPRIRWESRLRADHILNVAFYVPVTPIATALGARLTSAVGVGVAFSTAAETLQLFSRGRAPDGNDVIANVAGTALGAALVVHRRRSRTQPPNRHTQPIS
jgi:VanZ family protein